MTFQSLLPSSSGIFEKAIETVYGTALDQLEPEVIKTFWDPDLCPDEYLSILAHALSVDLWDDDWDVLKKRSIIKRWVQLEWSKGTYAGYRDFIEIAGGRLVEDLAAPQGFYLAEDLTQAQWQAWIDQMPRVRVTFAQGQGEWVPPSGLYLDHWFLDEDFEEFDDGEALYGRQAYLRENAGGEDQKLLLSRVYETREERPGYATERVVIPGLAGAAFILDESFLEDDATGFLDGDERAPQTYSYALNRDFIYQESALELTAVPIGYRPRDVRYYRESLIGDALADAHLDDWYLDDDRFLTEDEGGMMLADVLHLLNPDIAAPLVDGISFLDVSRLDMDRFTLELMIDATTILPWGHFVLDVSFLDEDFLADEDLRHLDKIMRAIVAAKAKRDKVLVTFETTKPLTLGDAPRLNSGMKLGARVPATL